MSESGLLARYNRAMSFPKPQFSRTQVNKAGQLLSTMPAGLLGHEIMDAYEVVNNWRLSHGHPINTFQMTLRNKMDRINTTGIVAQRLKRYPSIISKLHRFPAMKLATMQDIAGLRAVVPRMSKVRALRSSYVKLKHSSFNHELVGERDYISKPKDSGYRSLHLVYRYKNLRAPNYDGLLIELQVRTYTQHIWATAVETLGTFLNYSLKASEGPEAWLDFFSLAGSAFAHLEKCPPVPGYENLSARETFKATIENAEALHVKDRLEAYTSAVEMIAQDSSGSTYHLIILDPIEKTVSIKSFSQLRLKEANEEYIAIEKRIADGAETVQFLKDVKEHAEQGDLEWLKPRAKVYAAIGAA